MRAALILISATILLAVACLVVSVLSHPMLPEVPLGSVPRPQLKLRPETSPPHPSKRATLATSPRPQEESPSTKAARELVRAAYVLPWDDQSFESLKARRDQFDLVFVEWFHVTGDNASLTRDSAELLDEIGSLLRGSRWLPIVNNFNGSLWEGEPLVRALANDRNRARLIDDVLRQVRSVGASGACVQFEDIPDEALPTYFAFVGELALALHREHLLLAVGAPVDEYPLDEIARYADWVVLRAFDQHWAAGEPGPLAAHDWFARSLALGTSQVPPDKLIVAIGNYAYDWVENEPPAMLAYEEAILSAASRGAEWRWDVASLNPYYEYRDDRGRRHRVWGLDATTAFNQMSFVRSRAGGVALWPLGSEDPSLWQIWHSPDAQRLVDVQLETQSKIFGDGEIMRVTAVRTSGRRTIEFDSTRGLIVSARFATVPSPYVVSRYGSAKKKIVLTFDDGPDPAYTPSILKILREERIPAVFFIVGSRAESSPDLLRQIFTEGHELGNHTFSHPDLSKISRLQLEMELSGTQRLLESRLGRQTILFRPPYDSNPQSVAEIQVIDAANRLGYVTVAAKLDPYDWKGSTADQIVESVLAQAEVEGNIVLLHDSGGDRTQTLLALPRIIQRLRERGFTFVSLAELLGVSRDTLMPPTPSGERSQAWMYRVGYSLVSSGGSLLSLLIVLGFALGIARLVFIGALAVVEARRKRRRTFRTDYTPSVAVIVPAYNEEKVIVQTVRSLLASDYAGPIEIIVVDDGSKDRTCEVATTAFAHDVRVRVVMKPNGGKSSALNHGLTLTRADIIVALDADTIFRHDTISKLVRHFESPDIAAVAGNAKVGNRTNLLTRWQALEYITCQNLARRAFSLLNCITVVPGAVGAWRREYVERAGGFSHRTLAEDADLTMALRREGLRIVNEDEAVALTEAPDTVRAFLNQRSRWTFGMLQAAFRHLGAMFDRSSGTLGWFAIPDIFVFQVFFPIVAPIIDLALVFSIASGLLSWYQGIVPETTIRMLLYCSAFIGVDYLASWLAFSLEPKEDRRLLWWLVLQRFCYRQLMYFVAIKSTLAALRGAAVGWGKLERKGTVRIAQSPTRP